MVYIVCTGSSLKGFDFERLKGRDVIAVNYAIKSVPFAQMLVALDRPFFENEYEYLKTYTGQIHSLAAYSETPIHDELNVTLWRWRKEKGCDVYPFVCHGFNSGITAINIAIHLGYKRINMLGFDCGGRGHFYDDKKLMNGDFYHLLEQAKHVHDQKPKDVDIINYSDISRCNAFLRKPLNTLFK